MLAAVSWTRMFRMSRKTICFVHNNLPCRWGVVSLSGPSDRLMILKKTRKSDMWHLRQDNQVICSPYNFLMWDNDKDNPYKLIGFPTQVFISWAPTMPTRKLDEQKTSWFSYTWCCRKNPLFALPQNVYQFANWLACAGKEVYRLSWLSWWEQTAHSA